MLCQFFFYISIVCRNHRFQALQPLFAFGIRRLGRNQPQQIDIRLVMLCTVCIIAFPKFRTRNQNIGMDQCRQIKTFGRCIDQYDPVFVLSACHSRCCDMLLTAKGKILMDLIRYDQNIIFFTD